MSFKSILHRLWRSGAEEPRSPSSCDSPLKTDSRDWITSNSGGNVIELQIPAKYPATPDSDAQTSRGNAIRSKRFQGLMNAPELESFFRDNYFGLGRHNGANYRSHEALQLGKRSLTARFQNILRDLIARRQEKMHKLQMELIAIEGISSTISAQLRLEGDHLQKDIDLLEHQVELSDSYQGWILDTLNRYQIGFNKGLREALDFELLAR